MANLILAYDFGTSGVKAALVDFEGTLLGHEERGYPLISVATGYAEQEPEAYWEAVCEATKAVIKKVGVNKEDIIGMSFSTQGMGIIPIDKDGNVIYNNITWIDSRARKEADYINEKAGIHIYDASDVLPKMLWFKNNEPDVYEKTKYILDCTGFLNYKATGVFEVDYTGSAPYSIHEDVTEKQQRLFEIAGMDVNKFPPLIPCSGYVGNLTEQAAEELGVTTNVKVYMGVVDVTCAATGAGCCKEGDVHLYIGTSAWISAIIGKDYIKDVSTGIYQIPSVDLTKQIYGGCVQSAGLALNWTINNFYRVESEILSGKVFTFLEDGNIFDYINKEIDGVQPGSNGILASPWLMGERCPIMDEKTKGVFIGATNLNDRRDFVNAMMECICYSLRMQVEYYTQDTGKTPAKIGAIGGGALSNHWMQMMADVLKVPVYRPENCRHSGAIGSAAIVCVGMGIYKPDEIDKFVQIAETFIPNEENMVLYDKYYKIWKEIYPSLKGIFEKLSEI